MNRVCQATDSQEEHGSGTSEWAGLGTHSSTVVFRFCMDLCIPDLCKTVHLFSLKTSFYFYCWEQEHLLWAEYVLAKEKKRKDLNCLNTFLNELHDIDFTAPLDSVFSAWSFSRFPWDRHEFLAAVSLMFFLCLSLPAFWLPEYLQILVRVTLLFNIFTILKEKGDVIILPSLIIFNFSYSKISQHQYVFTLHFFCTSYIVLHLLFTR